MNIPRKVFLLLSKVFSLRHLLRVRLSNDAFIRDISPNFTKLFSGETAHFLISDYWQLDVLLTDIH